MFQAVTSPPRHVCGRIIVIWDDVTPRKAVALKCLVHHRRQRLSNGNLPAYPPELTFDNLGDPFIRDSRTEPAPDEERLSPLDGLPWAANSRLRNPLELREEVGAGFTR